MRAALDDVQLGRLLGVYPGEHRYPLGEQIEVVPLPELNNSLLAE